METDDLTIPAFLRVPIEETRAWWDTWLKTHRYTDARGGAVDVGLEARQRMRRAAIEEERRAKSAAALAQLKVKHEGERYNTKLKAWVRDPELVAKLQEEEFKQHAKRDN